MDRWLVKLLNLKQSTIERLNLKWMVCFVRKFLDPLKIGNAIVVNTKGLDTGGLFVRDVVLKLLKVELEGIGWDILNSLRQFLMFGI